MNIDPGNTNASRLYQTMISIIVPRPIAWVSTTSNRAIPNLAPFSFFTGVTSDPPTLCISVSTKPDGSLKDTARNILENGEFVVNSVTFDLAQKMVQTSGEYAYEQSEFDLVGVPWAPSQLVAPPRVVGSPACIECRTHQVVPVHNDGGLLSAHLFIGRILSIDIDDAVLDPRGRVDPQKLDNIGRMGGNIYTKTRDIFEIARPVAGRAESPES